MTAIEWTHVNGRRGFTWNPILGCTRISQGCTNCYAMSQAHRQTVLKPDSPYQRVLKTTDRGQHVWNGEVIRATDAAVWKPRKRQAAANYFLSSMSDILNPDVLSELIFEIARVMILHNQHTYMVLSKRPEHAQRLLQHWDYPTMVQPSRARVWLGTSVEDQQQADTRIGHLRSTGAGVRFLSVEPLMGPVDLRLRENTHIDWVICGGESGPHARPMHPSWARSIRDQCTDAKIPFFFKQWGSHGPDGIRRPKARNGHLLDGAEHTAAPVDRE